MKWQDVPGWLTVNEGYWLSRLARAVPAGGLIVEVGCWKGRSTVALATGMRQARLVVVDHFQGSDEEEHRHDPDLPRLREVFEANLRRAGVRERVEIVQAFSLVAARRWDEPINLLFLDAAHDYESVRDDLAAWWPLIKPGGMMVIHDYGQPNFPGVQRAVDEAGLGGRLVADTSLYVAVVSRQ
jgi:predicted O-methyltransferase YrrM